jgi:hypothetical protein
VVISSAWEPYCGAELYPLPPAESMPLACDWPPVDPVTYAWLRQRAGPVCGPQPAVCMRGRHDDPYHWDGHGTWWMLPLSCPYGLRSW